MLPMISADRGDLLDSDRADVAAALYRRDQYTCPHSSEAFGRPLHIFSTTAAANV